MTSVFVSLLPGSETNNFVSGSRKKFRIHRDPEPQHWLSAPYLDHGLLPAGELGPGRPQLLSQSRYLRILPHKTTISGQVGLWTK